MTNHESRNLYVQTTCAKLHSFERLIDANNNYCGRELVLRHFGFLAKIAIATIY
jgi:hypothetical protein